MSAARGKISSRSTRTPSAVSSSAPLEERITGSATTRSGVNFASASPTVRARASLPSMPSFTARGTMSEKAASSWAASTSGGQGHTPVTPRVFWAVRAVTAAMPYTPWAASVFRSA